ncbi:MAG: carboxymuconolactone decarboxylase family protein [Planctomycetota bacterium]|jgi:AhpD family alkylhydroperoxidase
MPLQDRQKELIAIGASVTANCLACVEFHIAKAREHGAEDLEIKEAIRVGKLVRRGAADKFDKFAHNLLKGTLPASEDACRECP